MKYGLLGLVALLLSTQVLAENYRIVQSPAQKLDVWIDDVKDNQLASWCQKSVDLRIVSKGENDASVLDSFLPRVAGLMASQCKPLQQLQWKLQDAEGKAMAAGNAERAQNWQPVVTPPPQVTTPASATAAMDSSPADTTPWQQFSLLDGCHFRTWWQQPAQSSAIFVPASQGLVCGQDGWLSGHSKLTQMDNGTAKSVDITFVQGFPIAGLSSGQPASELTITTVNRERLVLANEKSPESWLVLPFSAQFNGWQAADQVVVQMPASEAADESALKARLQEVRKVWTPWLKSASPLKVQLVEQLRPELKNPAAADYRTLN